MPMPKTRPWQRADTAWVCAIVGWGLLRLAPHLGHSAIFNWDEAFHQAATRGVYETFFFPHLYIDPLKPEALTTWGAAHVWLHKPIGPFWFGAAMMHLLGITPLGLRLGSLFGELGAAVALYALLRGPLARGVAAFAGFAFLALPFGWRLTQGYFFGDATDCTLVACTTVAVACLVEAVRRDSWRWALASGAAVGAGFLCKSTLALAPLGVAGALWLLRRAGASQGPRLRSLLFMVGAFVAVAGPWTVYSAVNWPELFQVETLHVFAHLTAGDPNVAMWHRPVDAIVNEINAGELGPTPTILSLLGAVWLAIRAVRRRELPVVAMALWLWATWIVQSMAFAKVPACVWHVVPAAIGGMVLLLADSWRSVPLAAATLAAVGTPFLIRWLPFLSSVKQVLPPDWQSQGTFGTAEGVVMVTCAAALAALLDRVVRRSAWYSLSLGLAASAAGAFTLLVPTTLAQTALADQHAADRDDSHTKEVGLALGRAVPPKSVVFDLLDSYPPDRFEMMALMFWSGRMAYRGPELIPVARNRGYHPYLVSPVAEPFTPVASVPGHAWLRAYDLDAPAPPPPLPADVKPLDERAGPFHVLGIASGPVDADHDRYAIFIHADGYAPRLPVAFRGPDRVEEVEGSLQQVLLHPQKLIGAPWFILPLIGPRADRVTGIQFGHSGRWSPIR